MKESALYDLGIRLFQEGNKGPLLFGLLSLVLILVLFQLGYRALKSWVRSNNVAWVPIIRRNVYRPILFLSLVLGLRTLPLETLDLSAKAIGTLTQILNILLVISFAYLAIKSVKVFKEMMLLTYDISDVNNIKARKIYTQVRIIERMLVFVIVLIALALILMTFRQVRQVGLSILASASVVGIIIGFSAQKTLGAVFAGIQIALAQPIRLEDTVVINGQLGKIQEIGLTQVIVRLWDERVLVVPINYFIENNFENWTRSSTEIMGTVLFYADYTIPVEAFRLACLDYVRTNPLWDGRKATVIVSNLTDRAVELRALISAHDSDALWDLRADLREHMLLWMQGHAQEALPQARIVQGPNMRSILRPGEDFTD